MGLNDRAPTVYKKKQTMVFWQTACGLKETSLYFVSSLCPPSKRHGLPAASGLFGKWKFGNKWT